MVLQVSVLVAAVIALGLAAASTVDGRGPSVLDRLRVHRSTCHSGPIFLLKANGIAGGDITQLASEI